MCIGILCIYSQCLHPLPFWNDVLPCSSGYIPNAGCRANNFTQQEVQSIFHPLCPACVTETQEHGGFEGEPSNAELEREEIVEEIIAAREALKREVEGLGERVAELDFEIQGWEEWLDGDVES